MWSRHPSAGTSTTARQRAVHLTGRSRLPPSVCVSSADRPAPPARRSASIGSVRRGRSAKSRRLTREAHRHQSMRFDTACITTGSSGACMRTCRPCPCTGAQQTSSRRDRACFSLRAPRLARWAWALGPGPWAPAARPACSCWGLHRQVPMPMHLAISGRRTSQPGAPRLPSPGTVTG